MRTRSPGFACTLASPSCRSNVALQHVDELVLPSGGCAAARRSRAGPGSRSRSSRAVRLQTVGVPEHVPRDPVLALAGGLMPGGKPSRPSLPPLRSRCLNCYRIGIRMTTDEKGSLARASHRHRQRGSAASAPTAWHSIPAAFASGSTDILNGRRRITAVRARQRSKAVAGPGCRPRRPSQVGRRAPRGQLPPCIAFSARRFSSSTGTSSLWVEMCQTWPKGSVTLPRRSP